MQEQEIAQEQENADVQSDFVKEIPNIDDILRYRFFEESTSVFNGMNSIINMLETVLTESQTKTNMLRIMNGALNNFMLINEIIIRQAREQNLLPEIEGEDDDVTDAEEDDSNVLIRDHREDQQDV